ncbi:conserved exported protein of unknown function [Pararobbsia alpina]|uniref:hypothetical protein n=1 Tax=Pararobbsia alpina TaxID=621374 RepID=UPI0039A6918F
MKRLVTCSAVLSLSVFTAASQASIAPEPSVTVKPAVTRSIPSSARPAGSAATSTAVQANAPHAITPTPAVLASIAGIVRTVGLDPNSDNGRLLTQWLINALNDPDSRRYALTLAQSNRSDIKQGSQTHVSQMNAALRRLNADDRLALLRSYTQLLSGMTPEQCAVLSDGAKGDFASALSMLSPKQFEQALAILTSIIKANAVNPPSSETYSTAAILKADGDLTSATNTAWAKLRKHDPELPLVPETGVKSRAACLAFGSLYESLLAMKEPERAIASWDVLSSPWKGMLAAQLASNPDQYIDSDFDIQDLPAEMVRHLPKSGAHPMPYGRVVVLTEWTNAKDPHSHYKIEQSFRNMHDTGVIVSVERLAGVPRQTYATFSAVYGDVDLKSHSVSIGEPYFPPGLMPAEYDAKLDADAFEPRPGTPIYMPAALPSRDNDRGADCTVSARYAASKIDPAFTGDAVDLKCSAVGEHFEYEESYLYDYRFALHNYEIDDSGLGYVTKRTVSITH